MPEGVRLLTQVAPPHLIYMYNILFNTIEYQVQSDCVLKQASKPSLLHARHYIRALMFAFIWELYLWSRWL